MSFLTGSPSFVPSFRVRRVPPRLACALAVLVGGILATVACSSTTTAPTSAVPVEAPEEPTLEPEADAGAPARGGKDGFLCDTTAECAPNYTCIGLGNGGSCVKPCKTTFDCLGNQTCTSLGGKQLCLEHCETYPGDACASGFACYDEVCLRSCKTKPGFCPAGTVCTNEGTCVATEPPPPPAPPLSCSGPATATSTGIAGARTLGALTSVEREQLCDYTACGWGAYGASKACTGDGGTFSVKGPVSRAACLAAATFTKCATLTVTDFVTCNNKMNVDTCNALQIVGSDPDCAKTRACLF